MGSPSYLNTAYNESASARMPSFIRQSAARYPSLAREIKHIEKELYIWLKWMPVTSHTDIDIFAYWKEQEKFMQMLRKFQGSILQSLSPQLV